MVGVDVAGEDACVSCMDEGRSSDIFQIVEQSVIIVNMLRIREKKRAPTSLYTHIGNN